jgi:hypothetical protein
MGEPFDWVMKFLRALRGVLVVGLLTFLISSCKPTRENDAPPDSVFRVGELVCVATFTGTNLAKTDDLVMKTLQTNGIYSIAEGDLVHAVLVREGDVKRAIEILSGSKQLRTRGLLTKKQN